MNELANNPQSLTTFFVAISVAIPVLVFLGRYFWKATHAEVKASILEDLQERDKEFKEMVHDQMQLIKDMVNAVKESIQVIKEDGAQRKIEFDTTMKTLDLHIDELKHVNHRLETHDIEIGNLKSRIK